MTHRSLRDEMEKSGRNDIIKLALGTFVVYMYIWLIIGRCNTVEHRTWLSLMCIVSIGLGLLTSFGVCQLLQLQYSVMHTILPFLLLGIGVDDMFVIVQAFNVVNIKENQE